MGHGYRPFGEFLFERFEPPLVFCCSILALFCRAVGGVRSVPPYNCREQVFTVVAHHAKKFVVGLKNATIEIPYEIPMMWNRQGAGSSLAFPQCFSVRLRSVTSICVAVRLNHAPDEKTMIGGCFEVFDCSIR